MYQPDSPALDAQPLILNVPALQALPNTAVTSGVALPPDLRELLGKIVTYKEGVSRYKSTVRGDKAGGSLPNKLHDIFQILAKTENSITPSTSKRTVNKQFKQQLEAKELVEAWNSYLEWQKAQDEQAEEAALNKKRNEDARRAAKEARRICNENPRGPTDDNDLGTVVAALADVGHQRVWSGTSGVPHHRVQSHPVMTELLKGTYRAEDWPVEACAEVDVMKQYLTDLQITGISEIDGENLYFHADGWSLINPKNSDGGYRWKPWAACRNCSQWFEKINAQRI